MSGASKGQIPDFRLVRQLHCCPNPPADAGKSFLPRPRVPAPRFGYTPRTLTVTDSEEARLHSGSQAPAWEPLPTDCVLLDQRVPKLELGNQRSTGTSRLLPPKIRDGQQGFSDCRPGVRKWGLAPSAPGFCGCFGFTDGACPLLRIDNCSEPVPIFHYPLAV